MDAIKSALNIGSKPAAAPQPTAEQVSELKEKYAKAEQDHVFTFYDSLSKDEQAALYQQLSGFDPAHINDITNRALNPPKTDDADSSSTQSGLEPLPEFATASILDSQPEDLEKWYQSGLDLIAQNKVAVVLMAGGQGTRLGSSAPKGCFNIDLPTPAVVPCYFGLDKANVVIFEQGVLPCISNEGKILLESKSRVAVAPDGNGGLYQALVVSNVLSDMGSRGIEHIHAYCVDNCLVKVADPVFIGFSAAKNVDIATKVVRKRAANESVGLILQKNGKPDVVEYSEIDAATAEAEDPRQKGLLKFRAANIVNHYYSARFLESIPQWAHKLPHHVARKKIPAADLSSGETVKPEKPNGIKLEQFVFDVFPMLPLDKFACLEVKREEEFSPLKNARGTGEDDPDTSKADIMAQGKRWVEAAGATVTGEKASDGIEVSPLISYGGEGLEYVKGKEVVAPAVFERE
ncbi:UDP-N-acetylglucosamine pyrophosphorylase like protein [Verticillium longisporum]|uniref:UDP-N-acetylglucosamine diphosphorylase n=1 Tax=Verticillium longisporum TaxID=100787 RepID=A0A8I3AEL3_VERLO|nr:UDP-N-acetylglucosamine pyrophosphorylase like protein [Verticillium longisporum]